MPVAVLRRWVSQVDQSQFEYLIGYEMLKGPNSHRVYLELEWQ